MKKLLFLFAFCLLSGVLFTATQNEPNPVAVTETMTALTPDLLASLEIDPPPFPPEGCGCIIAPPGGAWYILAVDDCFSPCPPYSVTPYPVPGLGY